MAHSEGAAHMSTSCPHAEKHDALHASLLRVLSRLHVRDTNTLLSAIINTDAFLQPWVAYRDDYLLNPRFNDEGLCARGDRMDQLFEHIEQELKDLSTALPPLDDTNEGQAYTLRLYSSLVRGISSSWPSREGREDPKWPKRLCKDLYVFVKHLRAEYVHGHGSLMNAIEARYPSKWLQEVSSAHDMTCHIQEQNAIVATKSLHNSSSAVAKAHVDRVHPSTRIQEVAEQEEGVEIGGDVGIDPGLRAENHMNPDAYFKGFTPMVSSSSEEAAGIDESDEGEGALERWRHLTGSGVRDVSLPSSQPSRSSSSRRTSRQTSRALINMELPDEDMAEIRQMFSLGPDRSRRSTSTPNQRKSKKRGPPDVQPEKATEPGRYTPGTIKRGRGTMSLEGIPESGSELCSYPRLSRAPSTSPRTTFPSSPPVQGRVPSERTRPKPSNGFRITFLLSDSEFSDSSREVSRASRRRNAAYGGRHGSSRDSVPPASISTGSPTRAAHLMGPTRSGPGSPAPRNATSRARCLVQEGRSEQLFSHPRAHGSQVSIPTNFTTSVPLFPRSSPQAYSSLPEDDSDAVLMSMSSRPSSPETAVSRVSRPGGHTPLSDLLSSVPNDAPSTPDGKVGPFDFSDPRSPLEAGIFDINTPFSPLPRDDPFVDYGF